MPEAAPIELRLEANDASRGLSGVSALRDSDRSCGSVSVLRTQRASKLSARVKTRELLAENRRRQRELWALLGAL